MIMLGDQLAIAKETGRRLGMGTNMYPSAALLGQEKDEALAALPIDELIEKADGFAGVFPGMLSFPAPSCKDEFTSRLMHMPYPPMRTALELYIVLVPFSFNLFNQKS